MRKHGPNGAVRRSLALLVVAAAVLSVAGCDMVKVGAKCRAGSPPGRDASYVLFCQGGRWKRVLTIQQAADFIVSGWAANIDLLEGGGQTVGIGSTFSPIVVRVTRKDGKPVAGADVVLTGPASGASIAATGRATTDADGVARFAPVANAVLGGYPVTATVSGGYSPYTTFGLNNAAGSAASIAIVSGGNQVVAAGSAFAPVVVRAVDQFGNVVNNKTIDFSADTPDVWFGPASAYPADDGSATTTMGFSSGNQPRTATITARVTGSTAAATFTMTVVPGAPLAANTQITTGNFQHAGPTAGLLFGTALTVAMSDQFGNPTPGQPVTFVVHPDATTGASGVLAQATVYTDAAGIARGTITSNGLPSTPMHTPVSFTVDAVGGGTTLTFTLFNDA